MKIFIDAGHNNSNWNTGAEGNGLREQDVNFEVAKRLGEILSNKGFEIMLSRPTKETNLGTNNASSINSRWEMSNNWGADYFVSIHCNAGGGMGAETLYYRDDAKEFAETVQTVYSKEMNLVNRGIKKRDNIAVLLYTNCPSILVELAFIDNPSDADVLRNKQQEIAQAISKGILQYLNKS